MTKQTQTLIGIGAVAVIGYLIYKNNTKPKNFVSPVRRMSSTSRGGMPIKIRKPRETYIAGGYNPTHQNPDGSLGATWIAQTINGVATIYGFWSTDLGQPAVIPQGTDMTTQILP